MSEPGTHAAYAQRVMARMDWYVDDCRRARQARERDAAARLEQLELAERGGEGVEREGGEGQ